MDQLARALADDVDAEQLAGLAVKYQLQEPGNVAEDLAAGDLLVASLADFIGSGGFAQLLLVFPDHRDFRNRVDPVRKALGDALRLDPEGVAHRQPALFHRGRGECGEPDDVADRVNAGDLGAIVVVDHQPAAAIGGQAGFRQIELAGGAGPAHRVERLLGNNCLAAVEVQPDARAVLVLDDLQPADALVEPQGDPVFPQVMTELVDDFVVDERQQPVALVDQGHPNAESGKDAGIFASDHAGSDNRQGPRQPVELQDVVAGEDPFAVERNVRIAGGFRPGGDDDLFCRGRSGGSGIDVVEAKGVGANEA